MDLNFVHQEKFPLLLFGKVQSRLEKPNNLIVSGPALQKALDHDTAPRLCVMASPMAH